MTAAESADATSAADQFCCHRFISSFSYFSFFFFLLLAMAFTFAALAYILALIIDAFLIFFAIFHVGHVSIIPINEQCKCFL